MRFIDLLTSSSESLRRNTSRSLLTILGIVIGIAAVIVMLSIGQGAQGYILNQVTSLGADILFIEPGAGDSEGGGPSPFIEQTLTLEDVDALRKGPFDFVSANLITNTIATGDEVSKFVNVAGVDHYQLEVFPADLAQGEFIDESHVEGYGRVAVLGSSIATSLLGDGDVIGKKITINDVKFRVVGVLDEQGSKFFSNLDEQIYLPVTTMQRDVLGVNYVNYISAKANTDVESAKDEARVILRNVHNVDNEDGDLGKDDFRVSSQEDAAAIVGVVGLALTLLLSSIAAISLIVGGIGIMNMMLVAVTERTREIGLRKAIGATYRDILTQFLLESVMLTVAGGLLGVVIGVGIAYAQGAVASQFIDGWETVIPPIAIVASVVVCSVVGIAFGMYPARRAAQLDPIESLRYE